MPKIDKDVIRIVASDIDTVSMAGDTPESNYVIYDSPIQIHDHDKLTTNVALIMQCYNASEGDYAQYIRAIKDEREALSDSPEIAKKPWKDASNITIPICKQQVLALYLKIVSGIYTSSPLLRSYRPGNNDKEGYCNLVDRFITALLEKTNWIDTTKKAINLALRERSAIISTTWRMEQRKVNRWKPEWKTVIEKLTGMQGVKDTGRILETSIETVYDYPDVNVVQIDNFGTIPASNGDIQRSPGVWSLYAVNARDLVMGCMGDNPIYDKDNVEIIVKNALATQANSTSSDIEFHIGDGSAAYLELTKPIDLLEVYYRFPSEKSDEPDIDWIYTIEPATQTCIRAVESPWWHGKRPFTLIRPYPAVFGIMGDSVISVGGKNTQNSMSVLIRHVDNLTRKQLQPPIAVGQSIQKTMRDVLAKDMNLNGDALDRPGGLIPFPDAYFTQGGKGVQPFAPGTLSPTVFQTIQFLDMNTQKFGANDNMQGINQGAALTATQSAQIDAGSHSLIGMLTENCSLQLSEQVTMMLELCQQFVGNPLIIKIWNDVNGDAVGEGTTDANGQPVPGHKITIEDALLGDGDVPNEYRVSANGLSETTNQKLRAQQMTQIVTLLANEPNVMQNAEKRYKLEYATMQGYGYMEPEKLLGSKEEFAAQDKARQDASKAAMQQTQQADAMQAQAQQGGRQGDGQPPQGMPPDMGQGAPMQQTGGMNGQ